MARETNGKGREKVAKWIRDMLPKKCCNCGSNKGIQYHHIVPAIYGGNDIPSNIAVLCSDCHSRVHYGRDGIINHGDAVKKGIEEARKRGTNVGRKSADGERIMRCIAENSTQFNDDSYMTEHEIMELLGIKEVCYAKYKRKLLELLKSDVWPYSWKKPKQVRNRPLYDMQLKRIRGDAMP